jgi:hypothetical protein
MRNSAHGIPKKLPAPVREGAQTSRLTAISDGRIREGLRDVATGRDRSSARSSIHAQAKKSPRLRQTYDRSGHSGGTPGGGAIRSYMLRRNSGNGMASQYQIERARGRKDAPQQLSVLREKWPLAFPVNAQDVRPLATSVAREVAAAMGWSHAYTVGVLGGWKLASIYCEAGRAPP